MKFYHKLHSDKCRFLNFQRKGIVKVTEDSKMSIPPPQISKEIEEKVKGKKFILWAKWQHPSTTEGASV